MALRLQDQQGKHESDVDPPRKGKGTIADVFVNLGAAANNRHPRCARPNLLPCPCTDQMNVSFGSARTELVQVA